MPHRLPARRARWLLLSAWMAACEPPAGAPGEGDPAAAPAADGSKPAAADPADKCARVSLDGLDGRWIEVKGRQGNYTHRFLVSRTGEAAELFVVLGGFTKKRLQGEKRSGDWRFTEQLDEAGMAAWQRGERSRVRLFVEPWAQQCSLRVTEVEVVPKPDGGEGEKPKGTFTEYLPFPDDVTFSFRPCDGPAFLGKAAADAALQAKQLAAGGAAPGHPLGEAIPVGVVTDAAADGDPACTYDMDLYFDDRPAKDKAGAPRGPVAAAPAAGGKRAWVVPDWYAPYSGNHHFELYRHRTCAGGPRELIDVRCIEAVLE